MAAVEVEEVRRGGGAVPGGGCMLGGGGCTGWRRRTGVDEAALGASLEVSRYSSS